MIGIQVEIVGDREVISQYIKLGDDLGDLDWIFESIGVEALEDIQHRFDVAGPGWAPHAESTRKRKVGPLRILWATGDLRGSFQKDADNNVFRIRPLEAEFGTSDFKAIFHQEGRGHNPVRLIIDATGEQQAKYRRIAEDKLGQRARQIGFEVS
jgi:hypothetical protein